MSFDAALEFVLGYEGGYSNNPKDPGGETNLGITQRTLTEYVRTHSASGLPTDVRALKRGQAAKIYHDWYWLPISGDDLPPAIALLVFDCAVNQGVARASRILQDALGVKVDGVIGPLTIAAAKQATAAVLMREIALGRALAYVATGNMQVFGKGWFRRLFACVIEAVRVMRA